MNKKGIFILSAVLIIGSTQCIGQETSADSTNQKPQHNSKKHKKGPRDVDELFIKLDTNKDGKLSPSEVKGPLKNDFSKIDKNEDGYLSKEEVKAAPKPKKGQKPKH